MKRLLARPTPSIAWQVCLAAIVICAGEYSRAAEIHPQLPAIASESASNIEDSGALPSELRPQLPADTESVGKPFSPTPTAHVTRLGLTLTDVLWIGVTALGFSLLASIIGIVSLIWNKTMRSAIRTSNVSFPDEIRTELANAVRILSARVEDRAREISELRSQVADLKRLLINVSGNRIQLSAGAESEGPPSNSTVLTRQEINSGQEKTASVDSLSVSEILNSKWCSNVLSKFSESTVDPSGAGYAFLQEFRVRGATLSVDGYTLSDDAETGNISAVPWPEEAGIYVLLPGLSAINNWSAHFSPHRQTAAADVFAMAFDLVEGSGSRLVVDRPAVARSESGQSLAIICRGKLSGFWS